MLDNLLKRRKREDGVGQEEEERKKGATKINQRMLFIQVLTCDGSLCYKTEGEENLENEAPEQQKKVSIFSRFALVPGLQIAPSCTRNKRNYFSLCALLLMNRFRLSSTPTPPLDEVAPTPASFTSFLKIT